MRLENEKRLVDALRRGRFTAAEKAEAEACLARHPELRAEWEEELALNQLIELAPSLPPSSNFTAQVMQACRQSARADAKQRSGRKSVFSGWLPRLAAISAAVLVAMFSYHQHQAAERRELAKNLSEMSQFTSGASIELLQNFDAIQRLHQAPMDVDRELIAALQ